MFPVLRATKRVIRPSIFALILLLAAASSAIAFEFEAGTWSGPAYPRGAAATVDLNLTYDCGTLTPAGEDIEITHTLTGAGNVTISPQSISVTTVPDCTPGGDPVAETVTVTYTAGDDMLAGSTATITVTATGPGISEEETAEETLTAVVGATLEVTYEAVNETRQALPGDTVEFHVRVNSTSNDEIMVMPSAETPDGWPASDPAPVTIASPLEEGEDGEGMITVSVEVPANATAGDHTITVRLFAHSVATPSEESPEVSVPLTVQVSEPPPEADSNDGPAPAFALVLLVVAGILAARRRR